MFKLSIAPTFREPIEVYLQGDSTKHTFTIEFHRLTKPELDELKAQVRSGVLDDRAVCKRIIAGWSDIRDADGAELPFSESALDDVLDINRVEAAIIERFFASANGARQKN